MTSNSKDYVLGIDLGTTNSCSAIMLKGKLEVIFDVVTQKKIIPSVICYKGKEEKDILIGENAVNNLKQYINSTIFESKRLLGHNFNDPEIVEDIKNSNVKIKNDNNKPQYVLKINKEEIKKIYPEEVSRRILNYFKENAKKFIELKTKEKNVKIEKAVITIPHHFNENRRKLTEKIGKEVFKEEVKLIEEPIAIGIGYGFIHPCKEGKTFLFFDIGGGSFGISIFKIKDQEYKILALGGGGHLGGENFNKALIDHVKKKISEDSKFKGKIDFTNKDPKTLRILFEIKKKVNKVLSQLIKDAKTKFIYEDLIEDQDFILEITQKEYCDELCKDLWEKIFKEIDEVFKENKNITKNDINEIILVGGSSRTPGIESKIKEYFGKNMILQDVNVDEIVAQGAAVYTNKNIEITDLTKK
jgi:molecular chaperone DnaK (HSP70)